MYEYTKDMQDQHIKDIMTNLAMVEVCAHMLAEPAPGLIKALCSRIRELEAKCEQLQKQGGV